MTVLFWSGCAQSSRYKWKDSERGTCACRHTQANATLSGGQSLHIDLTFLSNFWMSVCEVLNQARTKSTNPNFWVWISSGGIGVFHVKGLGPKSSVCPLKPRETKLLGRISWDFCRDIPAVPEIWERNRVKFPFPNQSSQMLITCGLVWKLERWNSKCRF